MDDAKWIALDKVAARCGCTYGGKPSWRRLLTLIARCVLAVSMRDKVRMHEIRKRRVSTVAELDAHAERDRLRQEKIRRAAGIPPQDAEQELEPTNGLPPRYIWFFDRTQITHSNPMDKRRTVMFQLCHKTLVRQDKAGSILTPPVPS